jgi:hypothetical protein
MKGSFLSGVISDRQMSSEVKDDRRHIVIIDAKSVEKEKRKSSSEKQKEDTKDEL